MAEDIILRLKGDNADLRAKLAEAQTGVEGLTSSVEELQDTSKGDGIEALNTELQELEDRLYNAERAHEANRRELAQHEQDLLNAAKAAKEDTGALGGLFDGLTKLQKGFAAVGGAILAFKTSFNQTRQVIKFFREQFGIDFDAMVKNVNIFGLSIDSVAEKIAKWQGVSEQAGHAQEELANKTRALDNLGIQHAGTIEDINAKWAAWIAGRQERGDAMTEQARAFGEFAESVTGLDLTKVDEQINNLLLVFAEVSKQEPFLDGPFSEELFKRVDELGVKFDKFPEHLAKAVPPELRAQFEDLRTRLEGAAGASDKLAASQAALADAAGQVVEELQKQVEGLDKTRQSIRDLETDANDGLSRLIGKFEELSEAQDPERVVELENKIADLVIEYDSLGDSLIVAADTEERRTEIQEEIIRLENQIEQANRAAAEAFTEGAQKQIELQTDFARLLGDYEQQIQSLPEHVRPALQALIDQYQHQNEVIGASGKAVEDFKTKWVANLSIANSAVEGLRDRTTKALSDARGAFDDMAVAAGASFDAATASARGFNAELDRTIEKLRLIREGVPAVADAVEQEL